MSCELSTTSPDTEALPNTADLPSSAERPDQRSRPLRLFLEILGDTLAVLSLFFLLFAALFIGGMLQ